MGFKDTMSKKYADAYIKKNGDRITQVQGHILSVKLIEKTILWIFHKLQVDLVVKPERSKAITRCQYMKKRWFKKPVFMHINQGNLVVIQGLKGKKGKENSDVIAIMNIRNLTTKKDLVAVDQKVQVQRVKQRPF